MKKKWRKLQAPLIVTGVLLAVLIGAYLFLMSEYSLRNLWFPILEDRTGIRIAAEECSLSLFRKHSFQASGMTLEHDEFSLSAKHADIQADIFRFLFDDILEIHSMEADLAVFTVKNPVTPELIKRTKAKRTVQAPPPTALPADLPQKSPPRKKKKTAMPIHVGSAALRNLELRIHGANGETFFFHNAEAVAENLIPEQEATVKVKGRFQSTAKEFSVTDSLAAAVVKFRLPKEGYTPESLALEVKVAQADIVFQGEKLSDNQLSLILEAERKGTQTQLKEARLLLTDAEGKVIFSVNLKGTVGDRLSSGSVEGKLIVPASETGRRILSKLSRTELKNFSAEFDFKSKITAGVIETSVKTVARAESVAPEGAAPDSRIPEPELRANADLIIAPGKITVSKADVAFIQKKKVLGRFQLQSSWVLEEGELPAMPRVKVVMNHFPLLLLVPFGIDPKYAEGTVDVVIDTKPGEENSSVFFVKGSTGFSVAEIGKLSVDMIFTRKGKQVTVEKGNISIAGEGKSVMADLSGLYMTDFSSMEFDTAFVIKNPGAVFQIRELEGFTEIKPKIQFKALRSRDGTFDLWMEGASGKYRLDLVSKFEHDQSVSKSVRGIFRLRSGETVLAEVPLTVRLPETRNLEELEITGKTASIHPQLYDEISSYLPENILFDQAETALSFQILYRNKNWSGNAEYLFRNCQVKAWNKGKNARFDGRISAVGKSSNEFVYLQKGVLETLLNGQKMALFDVSGTFPRKNGGKYELAMNGEEMNFVLFRKFMEKAFPDFDFLRRLADLTRKKPMKVAKSVPMKPSIPAAKSVPAKNTVASAKTVPAKSLKKMPAINLSRYDGSRLKFHIKRLICTGDLIVSWKGTACIKGKMLDVRTEELLLNRKPGLFDFTIDPSVESRYAYTVILRLSDFPFQTLCKIMSEGKYSRNSGNFRSLDLFAKGTGFSPEQIKNNVQGVLRFEMEKFSLNTQDFQEEELLQMALNPLQSVEPMLQMKPKLATTSLGQYLIQLSKELKLILSGKKNLEFALVKTDLQFQQGILHVKNIELIDGVIDSEQLSGYMHLPTGTKKLNSVLTVQEISIPFRIVGPGNKYKLDFSKTPKNLLKYNSRTLRDSKKFRNVMTVVRELMEAYQ